MKEILKRLKDLIVKAISIKVGAAIVVTVCYLQSTATSGIIGLAITAFMWVVVIGNRTIEKYFELLKVAKG